MAEYKKPASLEYFLLELVLNSLYSEATAIAVRIDLHKKRITVIDNGYGISRNDLLHLGESRVKNKNSYNCAMREERIFHLEQILIQIRGISSFFVIMSKKKDSPDTYGTFFGEGQVPEIRKLENRPSCGTTVTVYASTKFCQWNDKIDTFTVRYIIGYLAIVNTQVSFSVRDDTSQSILLRIGKNQKRRKLLSILCERPLANGQVSRIKGLIFNKINIEVYWGIECTSNKIHQIFLNLRPVNCPVLQKLMKRIVKHTWHGKVDFYWEKTFFLFYIQSPETEYKLTSKEDECVVEFHETVRIVRCIKKILTKRCLTNEKVNNKQSHPLLFFRPNARIIKSKKNRSFFTNLPKQYFVNKVNGKDIKSTNNSLWKKRLSKLFEKEDLVHKATEKLPERQNTDGAIFVSRQTSESNPESNSTEKNITVSQTSVAKSKNNLHDSSPLSQNVKPDEISSNQNQNILENSHRLSVIENCTEKLEEEEKENQSILRQKSEDPNVSISQTENRGVNLAALRKNYNNHDISWISQRCAEKSQQNVRTSQHQLVRTPDETQANFAIENLSPWSNWTYHSEIRNEKTTTNKPIIYQRFRFLPVHLHALLPHGKVKLTDRDPVDSSEAPPNFHLNLRRQDHEVRACTKPTFEFKLKSESLKSMEVLNQVNREFIVALTKQDGKKLLVIIDQHAMHERIRYENLFKAYKGQLKNQQFISVALRRPITISDFSSRDCELLYVNRKLLIRFGLNLSQRNENVLSIDAVPRCFLRRSFDCSNRKLEISVRKLLQEIVEDLIGGRSKLLPFTINDAIASEACRGSIKFGDPLTPEQCDILVSCWKDTDAPNRCAHGRPSVIPLLELSTYGGNENGLNPKVKLNFGSLRKPREYIGPVDIRK